LRQANFCGPDKAVLEDAAPERAAYQGGKPGIAKFVAQGA
jgi:hypothetical protein